MKAITYNLYTDEFLEEIVDLPKITNQDILVKVQAVGLNPVDSKINLWKGMISDMAPGYITGLDVSGEVVEIGCDVKGINIGEKVLFHGNMFRKNGGFAEYCVQNFKMVIKHPNVAPEMAAALPCAGWTAYRALTDKLKISKGDSLFIAGGSGGVGSFAIQIAKHLGAYPIIVTCSLKNKEYVMSLGADYAVDYNSEDILARIVEITQGKKVMKALDCVGGTNGALCANSLAYEGEMVELVDMIDTGKYQNAFLKGIGVHHLSLGSGHQFGERGAAKLVKAGTECTQLLEKNIIRIESLKVISLSEVPNALYEIRNQRTVGKIVAKLYS
ncbi:MAG: zinc-binding dehydrogenase [Fusobacteria bacterium]|nr:zinc-binding dehydrogenase [Fusobacteriota bacterium]